MSEASRDERALLELDFRLKTVLPEQYQESYEEVEPIPMGSAGLKYTADGQVAWDEIWESFCDLAMAGGPPHKGRLLQPGRAADIESQRDAYSHVVQEICRGITLATELQASPSPVEGWCRIACYSNDMAGWLLRAIVMENVAARSEGSWLDLPAAPGFRLDKEIKNVVTVIAKTCHYWMGHMSYPQQWAIARLFAALAVASPLIVPDDRAEANGANTGRHARERIVRETGLPPSSLEYPGWLGLDYPDVRAAIWTMRAMVVNNVLSRREETVLFVPLNAAADPDGARVAATLGRVQRLAAARGLI